MLMNSMGAADVAPEEVAFCTSVADVQQVVRGLNGRKATVRAGRHSYAMTSHNPGVVIDVSQMNTISLDAARQLVTVGTGVKNFQVQHALYKAGFMVPLGTGPSVGAGFVLGGGYSLASKYLGMGCDAVAAMEVVLADGSVVRASETENPDLLWALRGGGSSGFGVVTAMTLRVSPLPRTVSLMRFEWADGAAALPHWEDFLVLTLKDRRVNPQGLMKSNGGARSNVFYFGPISELEALVAPWLAKAPPLVSVSKKEGVWMDFVEQFGSCISPDRLGPAALDKSCQVVAHTLPSVNPTRDAEKQAPWVAMSVYIRRRIGREGWAKAMNALKQRPGLMIIVDAHGGAINEMPEMATAYTHRDRLYHFQILGYFGSNAGRQVMQDKAKSMYDFLVAEGLADGGSYINYPNMAMLQYNWGPLYFGPAWPKLVELKARYDPRNVFQHAFSIPVGGAVSAPAAAAIVRQEASELRDGIDVSDCSAGYGREMILVETELGGQPRLNTRVSVCSSNDRLIARFTTQEWPVQPTFLTNGCNDMTNPPWKQGAVEAFLGWSSDQSSLLEYLEVEASPIGVLWSAAIKLNAAGKMVGTTPLPCATSGITATVTPMANSGNFKVQLTTLSIPLAALPGYGRGSRLFGTFLRMNYADQAFAQRKELQSWRAHGARAFHMPSKFAQIRLVGAAQSASGAAPLPPPRPAVLEPRVTVQPAAGSVSTQCVTERGQVRIAQQALIASGFLKGAADGLWGRMSLDALNRFQQQRSLPVTQCLTTGALEQITR